jgi:hypothetical protein
VAYGLNKLAQKIADNGAVLTEVWVRMEQRAGVDGVESGGVARRCARVQVVAEVLRVCWCVKEVRASIAKA